MRKTSLWTLVVLVAVLAVGTSVFAAKGGNGKPGGGGGGGEVAFAGLTFMAQGKWHPVLNGWAIYTVEADGSLGRIDEEVLPHDGINSFSHGSTRIAWSPAGDVLAASTTGGGGPLEPNLVLRDPVSGDWDVYTRIEGVSHQPLGPWTRQRDASGDFLPYTQQRLPGVHNHAWPENPMWDGNELKNLNVALFPPNDVDSAILLTDYRIVALSATVYEYSNASKALYIPEQPESPGRAWMVYHLSVQEHAVGVPTIVVADEWRILTLDVSAWPAVTVDSDDLLSGQWPLDDGGDSQYPSDNLSPDGRTLVMMQDGDLTLAPIDFNGAIPVVLTGSATVVPISPPRHFTFSPASYSYAGYAVGRLSEDGTQILLGFKDRGGDQRAFVQNVDGSGLTQIDNGLEHSGDLWRASFRP